MESESADDHLVSMSSMASDIEHLNLCDPCDQDFLNNVAVCYCESCGKKYCQSCSTMHAKILREHGTIKLTERVTEENVENVDEGSNSDTPKTSVEKEEISIFRGHRACNIKLPDDRETCHITSCCYLQDGTTLLVDNYNQRLKLLSEDKSVINSLPLYEKPNTACSIDDHVVAITMADKQVLTVRVDKHVMKITNAHALQHECHCIAHHNDKLYIGDSQKIYKYSKELEPRGLFYSNMSNNKSVKYFTFGNNGDMYVTNEGNSEINVIDSNGTRLKTIRHPDMLAPRGLCVDDEGSIYICGYQFSTVLVAGGSSQDLTCVLRKNDGIVSPISICFDSAKQELLIGLWKRDFVVVCHK